MLSEKHFNLRPFKNRENGMLKNKRNNNDRNIHRNSTLIQNKNKQNNCSNGREGTLKH